MGEHQPAPAASTGSHPEGTGLPQPLNSRASLSPSQQRTHFRGTCVWTRSTHEQTAAESTEATGIRCSAQDSSRYRKCTNQQPSALTFQTVEEDRAVSDIQEVAVDAGEHMLVEVNNNYEDSADIVIIRKVSAAKEPEIMEKRLGLVIPDIDQLLDQLEAELADNEKPVITNKPVGSIPSELDEQVDHGNIVAHCSGGLSNA